MTDPTTSDPVEPINVKPHMAPVVMSESARVALIAGFSFAAALLVKSETALAAILPLGGVVATAVWSLYSRVYNWRAMRFMAHLLPDEFATVGRRK